MLDYVLYKSIDQKTSDLVILIGLQRAAIIRLNERSALIHST